MIRLRTLWIIVFLGWLAGACGRQSVLRPDEIVDRDTGQGKGAFQNKEMKVWNHEKGQWVKVENQTAAADQGIETPRKKKPEKSSSAVRASIDENERNVREALKSYVIRQHAALLANGEYALDAKDLLNLSDTSLIAACDPPRALPPLNPPADRVAYDYVFYPIRKMIRNDGTTTDARNAMTGKRTRHALIAVPLMYGETGRKTFLATGDGVYWRDKKAEGYPAVSPVSPLRFGWILDERIGLVDVELPSDEAQVEQENATRATTAEVSRPASGVPNRFDMADPLSFRRIPSDSADDGTDSIEPSETAGGLDPRTSAGRLSPGRRQTDDGYSSDERLVIDALATYGRVLAGPLESTGADSALASARTAGRIPAAVFNAFIYEPSAAIEAYSGFFFARFETEDSAAVVIAWPKTATPAHHLSFALFSDGEIRCQDKALKRVRTLPDDCRSWRLIGQAKR